jgi:hypothetical protein
MSRLRFFFLSVTCVGVGREASGKLQEARVKFPEARVKFPEAS